MTELKYLNILGAIFLVITASSVTYYIASTGQDTSCKSGWQLIIEGEREGQYACVSSTPDRYSWCYAIRNSSNTENYWCEIGIVNRTDPENYNAPQNYEPTIISRNNLSEYMKNVTEVCEPEYKRCYYYIVYEGKQINYYRGYNELNSMSKDELLSQLVNYYDSVVDSMKPEIIVDFNDTSKVEYVKDYFTNQ